MNERVGLLDLFAGFDPDESRRPAWERAVVRHARIDRAARDVTVELDAEHYLTVCDLEEAEQAIARLYGLHRLHLEAAFPPEQLETCFADLTRVLTDAFSPAAAILAGCRWELHGDELNAHLRANGVSQLTPYLEKAEQFIRARFGREIRIRLIAGSDAEGAALFEQTEQIRREAIKQIPAPVFREKAQPKEQPRATAIFGRPFRTEPTPISSLSLDMSRVVIEGEVFAVQHRELKKRNAWVVCFDVTDYTGSVRVSQFMEAGEAKPILDQIKVGSWYRIQGHMTFDRYDNETVMQLNAIMAAETPVRKDTAEEKRVELHLHTRMSSMDALTDTKAVVKQAAAWGHRAVAITDHGVVQSFPDAMKAAQGTKVAGTDEEIKVLYGCEAYYVNDVDDRIVVHGAQDVPLTGEFIAFDLETTGLSPEEDVITEIGAVRFVNGEPAEHFQMFVNPHRRLTQKVAELTGITDEMLAAALELEEALPKFLAFCGDRPLVAHNADFDVSFIAAACRRLGIEYDPTYLDTLIMAQNMLPELSRHKLDVVADALSLPAFQHHRADDDAMTVAYMIQRFFAQLIERGIERTQQINPYMQTLRAGSRITGRHARHMILFAKNQTGLRNLYRLVSYAHLKYFRRYPCIPKSELMRYREGLIIGSACEAGELFQAIVSGKSHAELVRIASFYDYLEIQPLANNMFMLQKGIARDIEELREFNRTVLALGRELDIPVVATGDVHFLEPHDEAYRRILLAAKGFDDADRELPLYFRTTDDMLREFAYLGKDAAYEVVVRNPNQIADMCERLRPVPKGLFAPAIENSVGQLNDLVYGRLRELYGDNPPELITKRVDQEMHDIISCHYDVIYMSAQKLVQNSLENGYLVGSRGSVGSSIVAYLSGITEVNSFPPHYRCPACKYTTFDVSDECKCGADLPDAVCPVCGAPLAKDGFNIPFETFLGFGGDKIPDIDLNFSGEYQARAHAYCVEMFGADHVFRAGTISTVAEKTAYGYVKKYLAERERTASRAEENRLASGCVGVKRTTGQHPGGLVVIPAENEIWDFCPVQHPADSTDSDAWITTHFEYHSMEENLLKLDMLGHDDPTMIRMLEDLTGVDAKTIPLDDKDTMSIFTSSKVLGYENDPILGPTGAVAIPEFNTRFTRGMLEDTHPTQFDTLLRLSGFSHGTDVWLGNARDLILSGTAAVGEAIGCRDDIMLYLISRGMPEKRSFKIMESVRKGRGLPDGAEQEMLDAGVPEWYIESCKKIQYLFPKAHAVAYVMMAFRIAWFKVHEPLAFYSAYFYRRSQKDGFDAEMMTQGIDRVKDEIKRIDANPDATAKDQDLLTTLEVCYEFYLRGFSFAPMDLYESDALKFNLKDGKLLPPFVSVSGLGETAALDIVEGRRGKHFISIEEFAAACPKVSKTHIESLKAAGAFGDLPDTSQVSLF